MSGCLGGCLRTTRHTTRSQTRRSAPLSGAPVTEAVGVEGRTEVELHFSLHMNQQALIAAAVNGGTNNSLLLPQ